MSTDGDAVLLSPELLGITAPKYANFVVGNVTATLLPQMIREAAGNKYVVEFADALRLCAATCEFWDFCHGAQAGNRFFEYGTFMVTETAHCRNSRQALVRAALDQVTTRIGLR